MQFTNLEIERLRAEVVKGKTQKMDWRRAQINRLKTMISENENKIINALFSDLNKPNTESFFEIVALKQEIKVTEQGLSNWVKPKRIKVPIWLQPGQAITKSEPLGCVLIIGAWNYPFMLTLQPLISAFAAGNTAILKPSEFAPATSELIGKLINNYFPKNIVQVFQGDGTFTKQLLKEKFDHIFFTGGSKIGKEVMIAASNYLTPVTLELGGKNPAIVINKTNLNVTARRLIWGKSLNSGQTCLAPNHILVQKELKEDLIDKLKLQILTFYGDKPEESSDLASINVRQFDKITSLIEEASERNMIIYGGNINFEKRKISPTLININTIDDPIISEEIFGPILPILTINNLNEGLDLMRKQPKPLAIYMFGGSHNDQMKILKESSSGGVCFNDVVLHAGIPELPFGGVGLSGMGKYHGKAGFDTFSHQRSILKRPFWLDLEFRYPPYKANISFLKKLFR